MFPYPTIFDDEQSEMLSMLLGPTEKFFEVRIARSKILSRRSTTLTRTTPNKRFRWKHLKLKSLGCVVPAECRRRRRPQQHSARFFDQFSSSSRSQRASPRSSATMISLSALQWAHINPSDTRASFYSAPTSRRRSIFPTWRPALSSPHSRSPSRRADPTRTFVD